MATKEKKPRPRKKHLPGMEPPHISEIDSLADRYCEARDARMGALTEEVKLRDLLEVKMRENGLKLYDYDGKVVELDETIRVRVRKKKKENGEAEE